jgi:NADH dehydrogenase
MLIEQILLHGFSTKGGKTMYLIVGSTGLLGSEICRLLKQEGKSIRSLVRATTDPEKVNSLEKCGAEIVQGDLRDRASLKSACQGVTAVISTASSMPFSYQPGENDIQTVDTDGQMNLIDMAKAAGVKQFIYTSFTMDNVFPLRNAKRKVEKHLKASGLKYTILRAGYFMEVWLSPAVGFDPQNAKVQIYGSGENPVSWISFLDVAKFAMKCLDNPAAGNAIFELGGPEALSPLETVKVFEKVSGQHFDVQFVPEETLAQQQQEATDPMQQSFTGLMRWVAHGDPIDMEPTLRTIPVELTSVKQYAQMVFSEN